MNRSPYLLSTLHLRSNISSNHFATSIGKRDFQDKLHWSKWSKSIAHDNLPPVLPVEVQVEASNLVHSKHCLKTTGSTWYSKLQFSPKWCHQRLCPGLAGVKHFQQEHRRSCHSWTPTVSGAVAKLMEEFERADIPESDVSAEYIVAHALGVKQLSDFARMDQSRILSADEEDRVKELADQKFERIPLQYIIGEWDFRDITLKMKPPVFIPRPETEMLVDLLVSHYEEEEELDILEVGCGSGAIGLSLLHEFEKAHVTALDASREAVMLTEENATRLGVGDRLSVHHTALTDGKALSVHPKQGIGYDVIVSNPPYLFTRDMDDLDPEISRNEDPIALEAGAEGLDVIIAIINHARHLLKPHGLIWLETDTRHHDMIQEWLKEHPEVSVQFNKSFLDFTDRSRFCQLEYTP